VETAVEMVEWCETNNKKPFTTSKDLIEKSYGTKLSSWKSSLKPDYKGHDLPPSKEVLDILNRSKYIKDYFNVPVTDVWVSPELDIVEWCETNKKLPAHSSKDPIEKKYARKLSYWKMALKPGYKGKGLPPSKEVLEILNSSKYLKYYFNNERYKNVETALEIVEWCETNKKKPSSSSKDTIEKKLGQKCEQWKSTLKLGYKGDILPPSQEVLDILTSSKYLKEYSDIPVALVPPCPHIWEVVNQDDEYHYKKCKSCGRRSKSSCVAHISGYTASNPEKKLEINTWFSTQEFIPGVAIVLDADDMKTCHLLPFDPSDIIVPEYDDETFESNSKDPKFGQCLRNGDFLEILKSIEPSKLSLVYADFTGHFSKWTQPLLEYLSSVSNELRPGVLLGVTWSENGDKGEHGYNTKTLGIFQGTNKWTSIEKSPADLHYGRGSNMCVDFLRK
jgi:hypothetical protein